MARSSIHIPVSVNKTETHTDYRYTVPIPSLKLTPFLLLVCTLTGDGMNAATKLGHDIGRNRFRCPASSGLLLPSAIADLAGEQLFNSLQQLLAEALDNDVGLDRLGNTVNEESQYAHREHGEYQR